MLVFIDTTYGSTFYIELNPSDKVLDIKNKIENSHGIPVSMQTLYYNGDPLLIDDLYLNTYNIVTNSRLLLVLPYQEDNNNQVLLQPTIEQSLAPSTPVQDSLGEFQEWSAKARSIFREMLDQPEQSLAQSAMMARHDKKNQDLLQSEPFGEDLPLPPTEPFSNIQSHWSTSTTEKSIDKSNVFHKEQSTIPSNTFGEDLPSPTELFSNIQSDCPASTTTEKSIDNSNVVHKEQSTSNTFGDLMFSEDPLAAEFFSNIGSHWPASTTEKSIDNSNVFGTEQSIMQPNTFEDLLFGEDPLLPAEHITNIESFMPESTTEDIFINKQPPVPSNSTEQRINTQTTEKSPKMKEVINIPDSPVKVRRFKKPPQRLRVMILPHSPENEPVSKIPVSVMANENVEELRKELEKLRERNELKLPEKGYFFIHKQNVLDDDKSFLWNDVAHGDTIEIFPGYVTKDGRTFGL